MDVEEMVTDRRMGEVVLDRRMECVFCVVRVFVSVCCLLLWNLPLHFPTDLTPPWSHFPLVSITSTPLHLLLLLSFLFLLHFLDKMDEKAGEMWTKRNTGKF